MRVEVMAVSTVTRRYLHIFIFSHYFDGQGDAFQRNTEDLWNGKSVHIALLFPSEQLVTDAWLRPTRSAPSLSSRSLGNPGLHQP